MRMVAWVRVCTAATAACAAVSVVAPAGATTTTLGPHPSPVRTELVFVRAPTAVAGSPRARVAARAAQASVAVDAARLGARVLARTTVPDALVVRLDGAQASSLAASPLVRAVLPDTAIPAPASPTIPTRPAAGAARGAVVHAACGTFRHPEADPEALASIDGSRTATHGYDGRGVTVALLADGLQVANADFRRNPRYATAASPPRSRVITHYVDFSGDGTAARTAGGEAFLDASSIAAQGNAVYDLNREVSHAHPLTPGCDVRITGSAPGATVDALKVFGRTDLATSSGFVQAIDWAVAHGVKVLNESFGSNDAFPDTSADIVRLADEAAFQAGVTVVVSTGDAGPTASIASPASDPDVLAVGASTTFRAYQQDTFGGINLPGERDRYVSGNISSLSSGGIAQSGKTVDLVAPGDLNWALCAPSPAYADCSGEPVQLTGGTSESSPLVAGAAADVIEAYRASHRGATPTPAVVMQILTSTARDLGAPADEQGAGLLDVAAAVALARSVRPTTTTARPGGVLASVTQLPLAGAPGSAVSRGFTITNDGRRAVTVTASTRTLVPVRVRSGTVTLDPGDASRQPKFSIWSGVKEVYQRTTLHVDRGVARIQLQAAYGFSDQTSPVHVAVFTPGGALAGYSSPQGIGDHADVEVGRPAPGNWTVAFFTVWEGGANALGSQGRVPYTFTELRDAPLGRVTPSRSVLAPGVTATLTYRDTLGSTPGDASAAVVLREAVGRATAITSVPVTVRTLVAVGPSGGRFAGLLTGGNGRDLAPGQANTFAFDVPAGERDLDVSLAMATNRSGIVLPADQLIGMLVDPSGEVQAYDTNFTFTASNEVYTRYLDLYASDPAPGQWLLLLEWAQPAVGARTSIPFRGAVAYDEVSATSPLPDAVSSVVPTSGLSYALTIHNSGVAPMVVSPDARLSTTTTLPLSDVSGVAATQPLPNAFNLYYVPTATSSVTFSEGATVPATFDASFAPGDPDLSPLVPEPYTAETWTPTHASLTYTPPDGVAPGLWNMVDAELGPYASRAPHGSETAAATATTRAFDTTVSSTLGPSTVVDSVEALATGQPLGPVFLAAGKSVTITIRIAPATATPGTVVTGTLFVDGLTLGSLVGTTIAETALFTSVLAAIPYEYTVG
jgi:hypothetical protein